MSNVPPGWYPDPWQQAAQRFWDGAQWTHRVSGGGPRVERPRLPDGAPVYGPLIWILALLPLLGGITIWFDHPDLTQLVSYFRQVQLAQQLGLPTPRPTYTTASLLGSAYWIPSAVGLLGYIAAVVLAYFDQKRLTAIGVVRPFHWAWVFLTDLVYVIGRCVIVRRVASPRGLAPLWVLIGSYVVTLTSVMIWVTLFVGHLASQLAQLSPGG